MGPLSAMIGEAVPPPPPFILFLSHSFCMELWAVHMVFSYAPRSSPMK